MMPKGVDTKTYTISDAEKRLSEHEFKSPARLQKEKAPGRKTKGFFALDTGSFEVFEVNRLSSFDGGNDMCFLVKK
ncbi:hypothetical protein QUF72_19150 [Desulfobacterales bacterium HSG2]|nr:hypothetical protein [Desulfobacterales bacterium HSG2]